MLFVFNGVLTLLLSLMNTLVMDCYWYFVDTVDAIGMNAIEHMRIVRNLPLNMGHKDSTSFTTETCFAFIS